MIEAFHLPALPNAPTVVREFGRGDGAVQLLLPELSAPLLGTQIDALLAARRCHLAERPVAEVAGVIGRVACRFLDPADPLRLTAEQTLPGVTGLSAPMVRHVLDGMAADWQTESLHTLLRAEFDDPEVLDDFRPRAGQQTRAFGPRLATHIFSGNVPGVAVTAIVRSLLVKAATLGKTAAGEPLLPALFARGIAEEDPGLGACLAIAYWPGDAALTDVALEHAEAVIVYGGADAVAKVHTRTPSAARFVGYGHRLSFGVLGREALADGSTAAAAAREAARDVALFDQQGCVSPHLFYVEEGGEITPREWTRLLAQAMEELDGELPRGVAAPHEAAAIHQARGEAEFAQLGGTDGVDLYASSVGTAWTVIFDPDPAFTPSCLNRTVRVKSVSQLTEVPTHVAPVGTLLQTVGIAAAPERRGELAAALGRMGASRIAPLGAMAWPPGHWHHDGRPPLGELVRWCDLEAAS